MSEFIDKFVNQKGLWTKMDDGWLIEISILQRCPTQLCPGCGKKLESIGTPDRQPTGLNEIGDVVGWRQTHFCGARLVIVND